MKAASICVAKGASAVRSTSAKPMVLSTKPRSSANTGAAALALVMLLVALLADSQQACLAQTRQFTLHRPSARLRQRNHLVGVVAAVWRAKQHGQHTLTHFGEEGVGDRG